MIQAIELRLGNLIGTPQRPAKVCGVSEREIVIQHIENCRGKQTYVSENGEFPELSHIVLNSDWLSSFGFKYRAPFAGGQDQWAGYGFWEFRSLNLIGDKKGENVYFDRNNDWRIDEVHQLQNLYYALTGEELELKSIQPETSNP